MRWRKRVAVRRDDPYWDAFMYTPPADPNNVISHAFRDVEDGDTNPVRTEVHSPNVMSRHIKELGKFYGADLVGIAQLQAQPETPFAIVCGMQADDDPRTAQGVGGQTPAVKGLFATFNLAAYIRELGYQARRTRAEDDQRLASAAGLGTLDAEGRLVTSAFGRNIHLADVIFTDLPLQSDGVVN
jgi:hypothetical protein